MSVIEASSAGVKDMADGSLRITFEFEPRHAAEAFALFGPRGRAVAVAALKDGAGAVQPDIGIPTSEKPKGGEWAKLAGIWCQDREFWRFINDTYRDDFFVESEEEAATTIRTLCEIKSRADLDHSEKALAEFNKYVRHPFMKWMQARGIVR